MNFCLVAGEFIMDYVGEVQNSIQYEKCSSHRHCCCFSQIQLHHCQLNPHFIVSGQLTFFIL